MELVEIEVVSSSHGKAMARKLDKIVHSNYLDDIEAYDDPRRRRKNNYHIPEDSPEYEQIVDVINDINSFIEMEDDNIFPFQVSVPKIVGTMCKRLETFYTNRKRGILC